MQENKLKIINDPIHGFISIPSDIIFDVIEHPYFQRLRRISQLGLTALVYPGAQHTRFHHVIGAMHLMERALHTLKKKGVEINREEEEAALLAILLHDIGHGPFSHALEHSMVEGLDHEAISLMVMESLNRIFDGKISEAIKIFEGTHPKAFLHQLVSSQLDMDRLDYLSRDSFFTGVHEGVVAYDRIIAMLNVKNGQLVVERKGIYSLEKFIIARRLMYWQVYFHKTVVGAEMMLIKALERAKILGLMGKLESPSKSLNAFLMQKVVGKDLVSNPDLLEAYLKIDDVDVFSSIKAWQEHPDELLSYLCKCITQRRLFKVEMRATAFALPEKDAIQEKIQKKFSWKDGLEKQLLIMGNTSNQAYNKNEEPLQLLNKDGSLQDLLSASDQLNIDMLAAPVVKHFLCYPKEIL